MWRSCRPSDAALTVHVDWANLQAGVALRAQDLHVEHCFDEFGLFVVLISEQDEDPCETRQRVVASDTGIETNRTGKEDGSMLRLGY